MKKMKIYVIILVFFILTTSGCVKSSDDKARTTTTESLVQVTPTSFEDQIRIEIEKKNHTGIASVSYWIDETNITYHEGSKTLFVEIVQESVWDTKYLNTILFDATFDFMQVAIKHPDKINNITIVGKTTLMDQHGHKSISEVYRVETTIDYANNVNWENLQRYGRYSEPMVTLRNNFHYVNIHPSLFNEGVL